MLKRKNKKRTNLVSEKEQIIKTKSEWIRQAYVNKKAYEKKYNESIKNNDKFWKKEGTKIVFEALFKKINFYD